MNCAFTLPNQFGVRLHEAIIRHLRPDLSPIDYIPGPPELEELLQVAVWASLQTDEGRRVAFTMSVRPEDSPSNVISLSNSIPLNYDSLARFSMATDPRRSAIHVGRIDGELRLFGIDTLLGTAAPVRIEVRGPARVAVKSATATVAIVSDGEASLIDLGMYSDFLTVVPNSRSQSDAEFAGERILSQVALSMHAHGHGGTLLVQGPDADCGSAIAHQYQLARGFCGLPEVEREIRTALDALRSTATDRDRHPTRQQLKWAELRRERYIAVVGRTTAVDGAVIISSDGTLLGFGAKITLSTTPRIYRRLPTENSSWEELELANFGGTRHQSAARFVAHAPGNRAIVASQDGRLSILRHRTPEDVECLQHSEWLI